MLTSCTRSAGSSAELSPAVSPTTSSGRAGRDLAPAQPTERIDVDARPDRRRGSEGRG